MAVSFTISTFNRGKSSNERVSEVMMAQPEVAVNDDLLKITEINQLTINNLNFQFPDGDEQVLKQINLTITKGQIIGFAGPIGSGRSILMKQLIREYKTANGEYLINGIDVNAIDPISIRQLISYVPQQHMLFTKSIKANLKLVKADATAAELDSAYRMADFAKDLADLADGEDTELIEGATNLSGGQKQRLSIARALLKDSEVLILDDSVSAVDGITETNILENLYQLRQNKTTLIIAHRLSAIKRADYIYVLDNGAIIEAGNHDTLMANQG